MSENPWLCIPVPRPEALLRLVLFHHAGGDARSFWSWGKLLPKTIEVCSVELPGHGRRLAEPLVSDFNRLMDALAQGLGPVRDRPFALFGHSLGGLIAFELARRWHRDGRRRPSSLHVSSCPAPEFSSQLVLTEGMSDADIVAWLDGFGATPTEIAGDQDFMSLLLPIFRSDLDLFSSYSYSADEPLSCSLCAYVGEDDPAVPLASAQAWRHHTSGRFSLHSLTGDHFYWREGLEKFHQLLLSELGAHGSRK